MKNLVVLGEIFPLTQEQVDYLLGEGAIYEDTTHDEPHFHLVPDHSYHLGEVEALLRNKATSLNISQPDKFATAVYAVTASVIANNGVMRMNMVGNLATITVGEHDE